MKRLIVGCLMAMALVGCTSAGENKTSENVVSSDVVNEADGTIGYYTDSICVLNDVYNDGYMGTFLVYDDLSDRLTKMVEIKGDSFDN